MTMLEQILWTKFGFRTFKNGQKEVVESVLHGSNTLAMLPTGTGKSLCYQLPGYLMDGMVIIVSPLLSLMQDQVEQMMARGEKNVIALNSFLAHQERIEALSNLSRFKFLFVSPEMLLNSYLIDKLSKIKVSLLVVDEAHCISQWGYDFRPDYLKIGSVRTFLGSPTTLALTATATEEVRGDIIQKLELENCKEVVYSVDRPNIKLYFDEIASPQEKLPRLVYWVGELEGPGIVYFSSKRLADEAASELRRRGVPRVMSYHAGLDQESRILIQQQFVNGQLDVICATSAFGMGINKSDVRFVIHYHLAPQIESYLQEIGRAGRDGGESVAILMYSPSDEMLHYQLLETEIPSESQIHWLFSLLGERWEEAAWLGVEQLLMTHGGFTEVGTRMVKDYLYSLPEGTELERELEKILKLFNDRKQYKRSKLYEMVTWIHQKECKRKLLLAYFHETEHRPIFNCCSSCGMDMHPFQEKLSRDPSKLVEEVDWKLHLHALLTKSSGHIHEE